MITGNCLIEEESTLHAAVTVKPNVKIKKGSIIGAGSVVLKNTKPNSINWGVPSKHRKNKNK